MGEKCESGRGDGACHNTMTDGHGGGDTFDLAPLADALPSAAAHDGVGCDEVFPGCSIVPVTSQTGRVVGAAIQRANEVCVMSCDTNGRSYVVPYGLVTWAQGRMRTGVEETERRMSAASVTRPDTIAYRFFKLDSGQKCSEDYDALTGTLTVCRPDWDLLYSGLARFKSEEIPSAVSMSFGRPEYEKPTGVIVTLRPADLLESRRTAWPRKYRAMDGSLVDVYYEEHRERM